MSGRLLAPLAVLLAALAACAAASAAEPPAPTSIDQPVKDGCQRNPVGLLTFTSPEWVYVYRDPTVRTLEGVAHATHAAGEDLPEGHLSYDMDTNIAPDPGYEWVLGGSKEQHTGNFAGTSTADEYGRLHSEWESGTLPMWDWPTEGDHVKAWGSWIWDCGHWGRESFSSIAGGNVDYLEPGTQQGEQVVGEATEFHPMRALVVTRAHPTGSPAGESETDAFVSTDGTRAHATEDCTLKALQQPGVPNYGPDFAACVVDPLNARQTINDRDYEFFVPAPPRPSRGARLRYRIVHRVAGGPPEDVVERPDGLDVVVRAKGTSAAAYGASFYVGWEDPAPPAPTHVQVTLGQATIVHSLDPDPNNPDSNALPPGEYNVYVDVGGQWALVNDWAPALGSVVDGQVVDVHHTFDLWVPPGAPLRIATYSRECDLPEMYPCADTPEAAPGNSHPGDEVDTYPSAQAAVGDHTFAPSSPDGDHPKDWRMTYSVRVVEPGAGSSGCFDTTAPRSRVLGARVRHGRLTVTGTAKDTGCGGSRVASVAVAVARQAGRRCRFATSRGTLATPSDCRRTRYVTAHGTRRWRLTLSARRLPAGRYLVWSRAIDAAGNVERKARPRNFGRFTLRR